jgi:chaperonin GroES
MGYLPGPAVYLDPPVPGPAAPVRGLDSTVGHGYKFFRLDEFRRFTMKIKPLYDRVLLRRSEGEEKTKGGIIIPDSAKEKPVEGKVVAVGSGKRLEDGSLRELQVKEGDKVLYSKYSGTEVKLDGVEHLIIREDDILAIIKK